jgi:hypothetical protein
VKPLFLLLPLAAIVSAAELPRSADAFVDSVGVNTHFSYTDSVYYLNFPLVKQALLDLKVRHIRDGLHDYGQGPSPVYDIHNQLAQAGIRCDYVVGESTSPSVVSNYPSVVNDVEALENANEADAPGGTAWVPGLLNEISWLWPLAHSMHVPIVGPALIDQTWWNANNSYQLLGDISSSITVNNLHNYLGSYNPETLGWGGGCTPGGYCYGSIPWNMSQANIDGPGVPIWTTENGYTMVSTSSGAVPETVYATYMPRLLLSQWNAGIRRTYIYELADEPSTVCCMGLLDAKGNRRTPFTAMSNLLRLLSDQGHSFSLTPLDYTISGAPDGLQHTLLQKHDGTYWLALWLGAQTMDPHTHAMLAVPNVPITVTWKGNSLGYRVLKFDGSGNVATSAHFNGSSAQLNVGTNVLLLKIAMAL